jgi:CBS-domain-containing membrane protein
MNSAIERLLNLRVADVMRREVVTLSAGDTMAAAADRFLAVGISGAPVVNSQKKCVGLLSATDFVRKVGESTHAARQSGKEWVEAHMSRVVVSIGADRTMIDAAREMCAQHVHRLPVVDCDGKLVGLVSSLDLVAAMVAAMEE